MIFKRFRHSPTHWVLCGYRKHSGRFNSWLELRVSRDDHKRYTARIGPRQIEWR